MKAAFTIFLVILVSLSTAYAQLNVEIESGAAFNEYNNVRPPNSDKQSGTLFSLTDDFEPQQPSVFFRASLAYTIAGRHTVAVVAAPLTLRYDNNTIANFQFEGRTYNGSPITALYQFNTYRLSYRYRLVDREKVLLALGITGLLRDAKIELEQEGSSEKNTDLGFVPLLSFDFRYHFTNRFDFVLGGDALVGPQGRAEDIFGGLTYAFIADRLALKLGYRLLEGGADVSSVYNFTYVHFASAGVRVTLF